MNPRLPTWVVLLSCAGCAIVTPLDEIAPSKASDAGRSEPVKPAADGGKPRPSNTAPPCAIAEGAECNPHRQCGCSEGSHCALDDTTQSVRCVTANPGLRAKGEVCETSGDCDVGLECLSTKLCSSYCDSDADCDPAGKCLSFLNSTTMSEVPGASACSRWCDVFSAKPCLAGTTCVATGMQLRDTTATCRAINLHGTSAGAALGESCDSIIDCAQGLGCAEFGPRVCAPLCRADSDCPMATPHCFFNDAIAAPNDPIGQCVIWPCNDATVSGPPAWSQGPVWSADDLAACKLTCGPIPGCYRTTACMNNERWGSCIDAAVAACAGARGGPCRQEYVRSVCCAVLACEPDQVHFNDCASSKADCMMQAERICAGG